MKQPPLRSFRVENFKAIRNSGSVRLGWLTAFIGNNGGGKSSLIEAMETFRDIVHDGVIRFGKAWVRARRNRSRDRHPGGVPITVPVKPTR